jgi:hypothetical protein
VPVSVPEGVEVAVFVGVRLMVGVDVKVPVGKTWTTVTGPGAAEGLRAFPQETKRTELRIKTNAAPINQAEIFFNNINRLHTRFIRLGTSFFPSKSMRLPL